MRRIAILILLICTSITQAQTETHEAGWEIIERCVGEPTAPPDDWSYEGTIIMSGYAGLHGMRSEWETPHVLARLSPFSYLDGAISPDANHFVVPNRIQFMTGTSGQINVTQIGVFDTTENRDGYDIHDWSEQYYIGGRGLAIRVIRWFNNEEFIFEQGSESNYQVVIFNIDSEEMRNWEYPVYPLLMGFFPSPDWETAIRINPSTLHWDVVDISSGDMLYEEEGLISQVNWSNSGDSVAFFQATVNDRYNGKLIIADNQLNDQQVIQNNISIHGLSWSHDGQFLSYGDGTIHIIDITSKIIYDTCITIANIVWSPVDPILAYQENGSGYTALVVVDVVENRSYYIGVHNNSYASMLGWRAD